MRILRLFSPILIPLFLYGCGGGGNQQQPEAVSKQAASEECMNCHVDALSPGTSAHIVDEWRLSAHNLKDGAGCADCHEPAPGHPNVCDSCHAGGGTPTRDEVSRNPDAAGKCAKCHGLAHPSDVMIRLAPQHFGNMTASTNNTAYRAQYVSSAYVGKCRSCHNPHNMSAAIEKNRQWADSGLGNPLSAAFRTDFKTRGTDQPAATTLQSYCVRCHTTTGYINFVSPDANGLRFNDQHAWGVATDKTKQMINCNACHDNGKGSSYSWARRFVPAVTTYYNYSTPNGAHSLKLVNEGVNYPDLGESNVCVPCHVGRGVGRVIKDAAAAGLDFNNAANVPAVHNRSAAATLAQLDGYEFPGRDYSSASYQHRYIGVGNAMGTGSAGPCVGCHMKGDESHEFMPVTLHPTTGVITSITSPTCAKCHNGSLQPAWDVASLQAKRDGYSAALAILNLLRTYPNGALTVGATKYPLVTSPRYNWNVFSPGNGANTMGAAFNYSMLVADPAGFAHNSLYAKRLIYDSIDWFSNGVLDGDVEAAINAATLPPSTAVATRGYVQLKNPITPAYYFTLQAPSATTANAFAQVKIQAISYLMGGPGGARP